MATKKKGPVHEAARKFLGELGIDTGKQPSATPPRPFVRKISLKEQATIAKGNVRNATAAARNKGTYSSYDPLSSIKAPTAKRKPKAKSRKRS